LDFAEAAGTGAVFVVGAIWAFTGDKLRTIASRV
jgi:hypothetical protein